MSASTATISAIASAPTFERTLLDQLESEAISIIREVTAETRAPVLLFSGGKDSAVLLHLARKAFLPARLPFPVMHVDTGHNFDEVIAYRDRVVADLRLELVVASVEESIAKGRIADPGPTGSRNRLQSVTLLDARRQMPRRNHVPRWRRDEDKARAKERMLSFRDSSGRWEPRQQRPEPWNMLNARIRPGEHLRAFPLSNWTELDIWLYIEREGIPLPSIYFSHQREVVERAKMLLAVGGPVVVQNHETPSTQTVRYRTVGDQSCTGAVRSTASTVAEIIVETAAARITERGATRADDNISDAAMEDRKREGYF
jgi:sulfate adenylyltransferase subunit 2